MIKSIAPPTAAMIDIIALSDIFDSGADTSLSVVFDSGAARVMGGVEYASVPTCGGVAEVSNAVERTSSCTTIKKFRNSFFFRAQMPHSTT